jgi:hypothetical protein
LHKQIEMQAREMQGAQLRFKKQFKRRSLGVYL